MDFFYPRWGAEHVDWVTFLDMVKENGFSGIEWFPFGDLDTVDYESVFKLLKDRGLKYSIVMTVLGESSAFDDYIRALQDQLYRLCNLGSLKPLFISAQIGREYYNIDQICRCLEVCQLVEKDTGVSIYQETHRNKWSYGIHRIPSILDIFPDLRFTLDISHWYCVSESFLEDQQNLLDRILSHTFHIHSRVGHTQGSQIHDVTAPSSLSIVQIHLDVWNRYIAYKKEKGFSNLTFTTEFGPPPYLISSGDKDRDYKEQWRQNLWIKKFLENNLKM